MNQFIVAEVSKNWQRAEYIGDTNHLAEAGLLLSNQFEKVIEVNRQRGYVLHSFQIHRLMTNSDVMNETIIAVFEKTVIQQLAERI